MEVEAGCWQGVCHTGMAENLMGSKQNLRHFKTIFFKIVNLSACMLRIHCSLTIHPSGRLIVL